MAADHAHRLTHYQFIQQSLWNKLQKLDSLFEAFFLTHIQQESSIRYAGQILSLLLLIIYSVLYKQMINEQFVF